MIWWSSPGSLLTMGFPYTDVNSTYDFEVLTTTLLDGTGSPATKNLVPQPAPPTLADGKIGRARGPCGETQHWRRNVDLDGSQFDCRGLVSISILGWCRVVSLTQQPFFWSVYDSANANGQAWVLRANTVAGGGNQVPTFAMYDGLTLFNNTVVKASLTAPSMTVNVWHLIGGSYNHATNTIACFWGDGNDPSGSTTHFASTSGFSAGFGFTTDYQSNNAARFRHAGAVGNFMDMDHTSYWKGRAFDNQDFLNHWQGGTALLFNEFGSDPGRSDGVAGGEYHYFWKARTRS